ncbi:MAG: hypothetical protein ACQEWU_13230 [Bacillota bacterium]|uniref:hypothetical protein n=1 Tax=Virgibacillus TaxID=84406 RepID=UPI0003FC0899|nr:MULTISPECIES: hypothetical protein [Bacillaceae]MDY7046026.1 hypothetical protein [Virgibacillus sp. M23]
MHDSFISLFGFIPPLFYLGFIVFVIWFLTQIIQIQRQRNEILKEILQMINKKSD